MAKTSVKIRRIIKLYIENLQEIGVPVQKVYLFGSQTGLNASIESDIDLVVVSPLFEKKSLWDRAGYLGRAAWNIQYPLDILGFAPSQVRKAKPGTLLNHIIKNGIEITN
ncbi:MAG: nucleotidyltransferase domain-containing protein [Proteobacteria bacterium]|nr:nucleotidyltransferase domain-containing protein [Pseudomonadota bacterium]